MRCLGSSPPLDPPESTPEKHVTFVMSCIYRKQLMASVTQAVSNRIRKSPEVPSFPAQLSYQGTWLMCGRSTSLFPWLRMTNPHISLFPYRVCHNNIMKVTLSLEKLITAIQIFPVWCIFFWKTAGRNVSKWRSDLIDDFFLSLHNTCLSCWNTSFWQTLINLRRVGKKTKN